MQPVSRNETNRFESNKRDRGQASEQNLCNPRCSHPAPRAPLPSRSAAGAGTSDDVAGVDDRRCTAFAGLEPDHDILIEVGLAIRRRLRHGDRPVLHVGKRLAEVADKPPFLGIRSLVS